MPETQTQLNRFSSRVTQPRSQGASQAMLYGTGHDRRGHEQAADRHRQHVVRRQHLQHAPQHARRQGSTKASQAAGLVGMRFNTIGVSDGISMGTEGMSYSLQSRDLIADSIETVMGAQWYDALIALPGCDKNMPGCLIAMGRLNRPAIMVYGGTIRAGCNSFRDKLDIVSAFQSYGEYLSHTISDEERKEIVQKSCPGAGACGGMYTANTMASAIEALGMSLPYSSSIPAEDPAKLDECVRAGEAIYNLLEQNLCPGTS